MTKLTEAERAYADRGWSLSKQRDDYAWLAGDWWVEGDEKGYGVRMQLVRDPSWNGGDPAYLRTLATTCRRFPPSERRPELTFRHHEMAGRYIPEHARAMLEWAAAPVADGKKAHSTQLMMDYAADRQFKRLEADKPARVKRDVSNVRLPKISVSSGEVTKKSPLLISSSSEKSPSPGKLNEEAIMSMDVDNTPLTEVLPKLRSVAGAIVRKFDDLADKRLTSEEKEEIRTILKWVANEFASVEDYFKPEVPTPSVAETGS